MNDHFFLETIRILFSYGLKYFGVGLAVSSLMVVGGSRLARRGARIAVLAPAVVVLWIAMFISVDSGYRAWQSIPNPPEEAFSDTGGPFFMLLLGWLPCLVILGAAHLLLRLCWKRGAAH